MTSSKYMVSQHFGRVAASVTLNALEKTGLVHLLAKGPKALDIEFHFSVDDVLTFTGQAGDIVDFAIRNAMSHVSRLARNNPVFPKRAALQFAHHPWIGDIFDVPDSGSTSSVQKNVNAITHKDCPPEDRRRDHIASRVVQRAILFQRSRGVESALALLNAKGA